MSEYDHWTDCWMSHPACALIHIRRQAVEIAQLRNGIIEPDWMVRVRRSGVVETESGGQMTHAVTLHLHPHGPTWSGATDDPPSFTP